jgi:type II secretion system protein J
MSGSPGRRGFTLLEVLLTMAIFSVILVLLLSSFKGVVLTREILSDNSRSFRQLRMGIERIGTDISGAFSSDGIEGTALTCHEDTFSGKPAATLVFTAFVLPVSGGLRPAGDIVKLKYYPKLSRDGEFLELYREESSLPLIENRMPTREVRLADRLLGFRVEFFRSGKWEREWPPEGGKKAALPGKVAFVLTSSTGEEYRRVVSLPLSGEEAAILYSGKRTGEES